MLATSSVVLKTCLGTAVLADNRFIIFVVLLQRGMPLLKSHVLFLLRLLNNKTCAAAPETPDFAT
jgi:hypothetical protein